MQMPSPEEQLTLAEIARSLMDFRNEFRGALGTLVRSDVYRAEQETLRAQFQAAMQEASTRMMTVEAANQNLERRVNELTRISTEQSAQLAAQRIQLESQAKALRDLESEKRQNRSVTYGAALSALVAIAVAFFRR